MSRDKNTRQKALDFFRENIKPNLMEFRRSKDVNVWLIALVVGICSAYAALSFRVLIGWVQIVWLGTSSERVFEAAAQTTMVYHPCCSNHWRIARWAIAHVHFLPGKRPMASPT